MQSARLWSCFRKIHLCGMFQPAVGYICTMAAITHYSCEIFVRETKLYLSLNYLNENIF